MHSPTLESSSLNSSSEEKLPIPMDSGWHSVMIEDRLTLLESTQDMEARRSGARGVDTALLLEKECSLLTVTVDPGGWME